MCQGIYSATMQLYYVSCLLTRAQIYFICTRSLPGPEQSVHPTICLLRQVGNAVLLTQSFPFLRPSP